MKRFLALTILTVTTSLHAGEIVQKPLDEFVIYNLPIAYQSGNTTVLFPSPISGLYAKSIAAQEQSNANFLLSFVPGNFYFTVRALKKNAEDHLTVIYNRKAYVLHLTASAICGVPTILRLFPLRPHRLGKAGRARRIRRCQRVR